MQHEYKFKYNKAKGVYEVTNGTKKIVKECQTLQEVNTFIESRVSKPALALVPGANVKKSVPKKATVATKEVGFGKDGIPGFFFLNAKAGQYKGTTHDVKHDGDK